MDWRLMLGLGMLMPSILIILSLTIMPESPRWLLMQGRKEEAMAVLRKTYPEGTDVDVVVEEVLHHIQMDMEADTHGTWHVILKPTPVVKKMLWAGLGLAVCQQLSGTDAVVYFSAEFLKEAGFVSR